MEALMKKDVIGRKVGPCTFEYTWRDLSLYALAVGAKKDNLEYLYHKDLDNSTDLKVLPSFAAVPYFGTFGISPAIKFPNTVVYTLGLNKVGMLHMTHEFQIHRPLPPHGAKLTFTDTITNVFDRGEGKGIVVRSEWVACDENGEKVFTNIGDSLNPNYTAPDGDMLPKNEVVIPDRAPDWVGKDSLLEIQNYLYRLTGDTNLIHADPDTAASRGWSSPIMQGLCTYGYACRMAINAMIPKMPERVTRFSAQMRATVNPGSEVEVQVWKITDKKSYFRLTNLADQKVALDKGVMEWK